MTIDAPTREASPAMQPETAYAAALRGAQCRLWVDGREARWRVDAWLGEADPADHVILDECSGPTIDLGCGPGRMLAGLLHRGTCALGVDSNEVAVRMARSRGSAAVVRDVFEPLPSEGRWPAALLADGNVGIGGDPARLLHRVSRLLASGGRLVAEVKPPGSTPARHLIQLEVEGRLSAPFAWASVPADQLAVLAEEVAMRVLRLRDESGRWVATLEKRRR